MFRVATCASLVVWLCAAAIRADQIATLSPSQDNTLIEDIDPNAQLSNGEGDIYVGCTAGKAGILPIRRGLMEFDIADSGIPANATITGATLTLCDVQGLNGNQTVGLYPVLQPWGQGTSYFSGGQGAPATQNDATWLYTFYNAANPANSTPWTTPGGSFGSTASATTVVVATSPVTGQLFSWSSPQMVADLQGWLDGASPNYGWGILGNETANQTAKRFVSPDSASLDTAPANVPPSLVISYTVPEPGTALLAVAAAAAIGAWGTGRRLSRSAIDGSYR